MVTLTLDKERAERIIESLLRISEAYQQKALEIDARFKDEDAATVAAYRLKSRLAAEDAHVIQLAVQNA